MKLAVEKTRIALCSEDGDGYRCVLCIRRQDAFYWQENDLEDNYRHYVRLQAISLIPTVYKLLYRIICTYIFKSVYAHVSELLDSAYCTHAEQIFERTDEMSSS